MQHWGCSTAPDGHCSSSTDCSSTASLLQMQLSMESVTRDRSTFVFARLSANASLNFSLLIPKIVPKAPHLLGQIKLKTYKRKSIVIRIIVVNVVWVCGKALGFHARFLFCMSFACKLLSLVWSGASIMFLAQYSICKVWGLSSVVRNGFAAWWCVSYNEGIGDQESEMVARCLNVVRICSTVGGNSFSCSTSSGKWPNDTTEIQM